MRSFHRALSFINFLGLAFCTCEVSQLTHLTARTHDKVCYSPKSIAKKYTPISAAIGVEDAMKHLEGRWKLVILFHLFGGKVLRFSELERAIPRITQKMLGQQLRSLAADGIVVRTAYPQVPPKVEYRLTPWGQSLCPALDAILKWADRRPADRRKSNSR
jgi:DNA-binding HxlR family transcriptional regulator